MHLLPPGPETALVQHGMDTAGKLAPAAHHLLGGDRQGPGKSTPCSLPSPGRGGRQSLGAKCWKEAGAEAADGGVVVREVLSEVLWV